MELYINNKIIICSIFYFGVLYLFPSMRRDTIGLVNKFMPNSMKNKIRNVIVKAR